MKLFHLKKIDSTNEEALRRLRACLGAQEIRALDKTIILADEQSAGRGRMKRAFYSPADAGLYFTAIHAPQNPIQDPAALTAMAAVAVCRSLKEFFGVDAKIKWVNDIYIDGKKVCGILAEGHLGADGKISAAAIGIGVNIYASDFPQEIADRAGAIFGAAEKSSQAQDTRERLAQDISQKLFDLLEGGQKQAQGAVACKAALDEYRARSFIIGKAVTVIPVIGDERSAYPATVLGIDNEARLLVRLNDGSERALSSGEISIRV